MQPTVEEFDEDSPELPKDLLRKKSGPSLLANREDFFSSLKIGTTQNATCISTTSNEPHSAASFSANAGESSPAFKSHPKDEASTPTLPGSKVMGKKGF